MNKHELLEQVVRGIVIDDDKYKSALKEFVALKAKEILHEGNDVTDPDENGPAAKSAENYLNYVKNDLVVLFTDFHNELDATKKDNLINTVGEWGKVTPNFREVVKCLGNINDEKEANKLLGVLIDHFTADDNDKMLSKVRKFKDNKMWKVKV